MMKTPVVITFANQKGGVGKTTLCMAFANYLYSMGVRVMIIDCDFQHSIVKKRKADIQEYGGSLIPYEVISAGSMNNNEMAAMIEKIYNDHSMEAVLIDSAGTLTAPGLPTLFVNSNVIVTPFRYDDLTSPSTLAFLIFLSKLKERAGDRMTTKIFAVPNNADARVGTKKEKRAWRITQEKLSKYGEITENIPQRAYMGRTSTVAGLDRQFPVVKSAFERIYSYIFDTNNPLRTVRLQGIQLTSYCDELERQAKKAQKQSADSSNDEDRNYQE